MPTPRCRVRAAGAYFDYKDAEKGDAVIVTTPIEAESKELQAAAAVEIKALPVIHVHRTRCLFVITLHSSASKFTAEICVSGPELRVEKIDDYDWAEDAIAVYAGAILLSLQRPAMRQRCRVYGTDDPHLLYLRLIVFCLAPIV